MILENRNVCYYLYWHEDCGVGGFILERSAEKEKILFQILTLNFSS